MIKWRVVTGDGIKAKRTYHEFNSLDLAKQFAALRGSSVLEISLLWRVKRHLEKGREILGDFEYTEARDMCKGKRDMFFAPTETIIGGVRDSVSSDDLI